MDDARAADDWWHQLPPARRAQVWRWVEQPVTSGVPEGQTVLVAPGLPRPPRPPRGAR